MASAMATKRLRKEFMAINKTPVENITAAPLESNILEWHYVIKGTKGSPYEGGFYHGKLKFPPQYPLKPPSVLMLTPSGRFVPNRRLCLSMSDFHPETWNPMWSVASILTGLYSFMLENTPTAGSMEATKMQRRRLAAESLAFNVRDPIFCATFPDLVALHEANGSSSSQATGTQGSGEVGKSVVTGDAAGGDPLTSALETSNTIFGVFAVAVGLVILLLAIVLR